jgi:hypothetical protein
MARQIKVQSPALEFGWANELGTNGNHDNLLPERTKDQPRHQKGTKHSTAQRRLLLDSPEPPPPPIPPPSFTQPVSRSSRKPRGALIIGACRGDMGLPSPPPFCCLFGSLFELLVLFVCIMRRFLAWVLSPPFLFFEFRAFLVLVFIAFAFLFGMAIYLSFWTAGKQ